MPPTVLRDGPFGPGMVQLWIDGDDDRRPGSDWRRVTPAAAPDGGFDAVVNNADRKGGHLIPMPDGHVYGVDHGVCFSTEDKLRTVLWQWAGEPLTDEAVDVLSRLRAELDGRWGRRLYELLTRREVATTIRRVDALLHTGLHPDPRRLAGHTLAPVLRSLADLAGHTNPSPFNRLCPSAADRSRRGSCAIAAAAAGSGPVSRDGHE